MPTDKRATSIRFTDAGYDRIKQLREWYGTTEAGAVELALLIAVRAGRPEGAPLTQAEARESAPPAPPPGKPARGRPRKPA